MKKNPMRLLGFLLAAMMVISLFPVGVFAEDAATDVSDSGSEVTADLVIEDVEDLLAFAEETKNGNKFSGKTVVLAADLDLSEVEWYYRDAEGNVVNNYRIIDFSGVFDGQGHIISNITLKNECDDGTSVALSFFRNVFGTIKNVTFDGINAESVGNAAVSMANYVMTSNAGKPVSANVANVHVKNLTVNIDNDECAATTYSQVAGLLRWAGKGLWVEDCSVEGMNAVVTGKAVAGGAACFVAQTSEFYNCDVKDIAMSVGSVESGIGGFAGQVQSSSYVQRVFNDCDVTNLDMTIDYLNTMAGGFLGNLGGMVNCDDCDVTGKITVKSDVENAHVGGFTGDLGWQGDWSSDKIGHTFDNCTADVDVVAVNSDVGGFVGMSAIVDDTVLDQDEAMAAVFTNCTATGDVKTVNGAAGGFVGSGDRGEYHSCVATGSVSGNIAGGFWGEVFSMPAAPKNGYSGKGDAFTGVVVESCVASTDIDGTTIGGLFGALENTDGETSYETPLVDRNNVYINPNAVAMIGTESYDTLADAITAANAMEGGATVTLLKDVTLSQKLTISGNVTIEGAHTITRGDAYTGTLFVVNKGATLTLDGDLVIDGNNNYAFDADLYAQDLAAGLEIPSKDRTKWFTLEEGKPIASAFMFTTTGGTINFKKVTVQNNYSNASGVISAGANSNILLEGATITHIAANNNSGIVTNVSGANINVVINDGTVIDGIHVGGNHGVFKIYSGAKVTINGGEIKNTTGWNSNGVVAGMYGGTLIMNGGIICSNSSVVGPSNGRNAAIYGHSGHTFVMNGGIICHNTGYSGGGIDSPYAEEGYSGRTTITGGMVVDNVTIGNYSRPDVRGGNKLTITGGIYTQDVTEYVAPGYYVYHDEANGYYIVGKSIKLVTEGSDEIRYFASIAEAVVAAKATEGKDTIYLLANHKEAVALFDGMTLDLQSFTLEAEAVFGTNGSYITGAVCKGADSGARLIVAKDAIALGQSAPSTGRGYVMPVWDAAANDGNGAFVFAELGIGIEEGEFEEDTLGVQFDISGSSYVKQNLLIDQASSGFHIEVVATWTENGETVTQIAHLNDAAVSASVLDKCSIKAYVALEGHENLTISVRFVTKAGVVISSTPKTAQ